MAQSSRSSRRSDVLILGSTLSGLLAAEYYRQQGLDVVVLEASDRLGQLGPDLGFIPDTAQALAAIDWLSDLIQIDLKPTAMDHSPTHFDEGHLRPFVGFGDRLFPSREEIDFFVCSRRLRLSASFAEISQRLAQGLSDRAQTRKQTTKLIVKNQTLTGVEVNGEELWTAPLVIAPQGPRELLQLLAVDALDGRHRARLAKAANWSAVTLHLKHRQPLTERSDIHILFGSGQEFEPVFGAFSPTATSGEQSSLWMTLVSYEVADDTDHLSQALKHLKRQLKRAYPNALSDLVDERLLVQSESFGHVSLKGKFANRVPEIAGLVFAHPLWSPLKGHLAAVDVARLAPLPTLSESPAAEANLL